MKKWEWEVSDINGRVCTHCKEYKLYSEYHKHKQCSFGYNTVCKLCRLPKSKENYSKQTGAYKLWHSAKTRAKRKGLAFDISIEDIIIPESCPILKSKLIKPSLDRLDNSKGYVKGNIRVISFYANTVKNSLSIEEIKNLYIYSCEI